jgi:hypothetical protein
MPNHLIFAIPATQTKIQSCSRNPVVQEKEKGTNQVSTDSMTTYFLPEEFYTASIHTATVDA